MSTPVSSYDGVVTGIRDLVLVEHFLNTLDERTFSRHGTPSVPSDGLTSVEDLAAWISAQELPGQQLGAADLAAAVSLRGALRASLVGNGEPAAPVFADFTLCLVPDSSNRLRLAARGVAKGVDVIVETVAASVADGRWGRLKLCASPDCRWAFYDTSRSGRGRWCSMEACGNRHKTRSYRERQRHGN